MPRLLNLGPDGPLARWIGRLGGGRFGPRGLRVITLGAALGFGLVFVGMLFAMHVSSTPNFCGSCHVMQPYYTSWKESKHDGIACVECHIPPGITAEFRKKYEALSMVVRYFTGTYGTNPWAEVDDAACLRCHERRLLEGKEVFHGVLFDHAPHLAEVRRGLKLRCTSCHSQIVQGSHIAVTTSTCALCHFKGQELNAGYGKCISCHEIPTRVVSAAGTEFDHDQVRRLDMDCRLCHASVVRGEGNVPRERCVTCHNDPERLQAYADTEHLHQAHVSDHKVDCMNCHLTMEHGRAAVPVVEGSGCTTCHGLGHGPQEDLYAGIGGRGVSRMPSPMFTAGVTCSGCHNTAFQTAVVTDEMAGVHTLRAGAVSCMSCHGPGYQKIFESWRDGVRARVEALRGQLDATAQALGANRPAPWGDARHNFSLVARGHGIHNVNFSYALLEKAHEQMNEARRARGLAPLARPWPGVAAGSADCMTCHQGVEKQRGTFAGRAFSHDAHLTRGGLACEACHRPHAERAPGEVVRFGPDGCMTCHHRGGAVGADSCGRCHGDVSGRMVSSHRGAFSHSAHLEAGLECDACHTTQAGDPRPDRSVCANCHDD